MTSIKTKQRQPDFSKWNETVVKLCIGKSVRRIPITRFLSDVPSSHKDGNSNPSVSYSKFEDYVMEYSLNAPVGKVDRKAYSIRITYKDEENEDIDVSSDVELTEAILSLFKHNSNYGEWVIQDADAKDDPAQEDNREGNNEVDDSLSTKDKYILRMYASVHRKRNASNRKPVNPNFNDIFGKLRRISTSSDPSFAKAPAVAAIDSVFSFVADIVKAFDQAHTPYYERSDFRGSKPQQQHNKNIDMLKKKVVESPEKKKQKKQQAQENAGYELFDAEFVHGRHACDSCGMTPIVGYRYHSLVKPNYDICHNCFREKVNREDNDVKTFTLEQYKPDLTFKRQKFNLSGVCYSILHPYHNVSHEKRRNIDARDLTDVIVNEKIISRCMEDIKRENEEKATMIALTEVDPKKVLNAPTITGDNVVVLDNDHDEDDNTLVLAEDVSDDEKSSIGSMISSASEVLVSSPTSEVSSLGDNSCQITGGAESIKSTQSLNSESIVNLIEDGIENLLPELVEASDNGVVVSDDDKSIDEFLDDEESEERQLEATSETSNAEADSSVEDNFSVPEDSISVPSKFSISQQCNEVDCCSIESDHKMDDSSSSSFSMMEEDKEEENETLVVIPSSTEGDEKLQDADILCPSDHDDSASSLGGDWDVMDDMF